MRLHRSSFSLSAEAYSIELASRLVRCAPAPCQKLIVATRLEREARSQQHVAGRVGAGTLAEAAILQIGIESRKCAEAHPSSNSRVGIHQIHAIEHVERVEPELK